MAVATLLDPRFKGDFFEDPLALEDALHALKAELADLCEPVQQVEQEAETSGGLEQGLWANRHKFKGPTGQIRGVLRTCPAAIQLEGYLQDPVVEAKVDPIQYWKNENRFPELKKLALKYLCVMGTSCPSERLFSQAGNIITLKRNRLTADNLSRFLFISQCPQEDWDLGV